MTTTQQIDLVINKMTQAQYNSITPSATELYFITDDPGITSTDVTTALGYTPYDSSNPSGYTSNVGTVTSVNNVSPDSNGNVSLTIPDTSTLANYNLSNLTATGKTKVVTLAHELNWTNAISVATTDTTNGTYTPTADGLFCAYAAVSGGSASKGCQALLSFVTYDTTDGISGNFYSGTDFGYCCAANIVVMKGQTVYYRVAASGGSSTNIRYAKFIPFKKS